MVMAGAASDLTSTTELVVQIWKLSLNRAEPKPLRKEKKKKYRPRGQATALPLLEYFLHLVHRSFEGGSTVTSSFIGLSSIVDAVGIL